MLKFSLNFQFLVLLIKFFPVEINTLKHSFSFVLLLISRPVPLCTVCLNEKGVYTDSMTEINTLSHAELSYQSNPCGVLVDMDTVNIAENTLLTLLKVHLCVIPLWLLPTCAFCI